MSNTTLRLILATSVVSLGVNAATLAIVVRDRSSAPPTPRATDGAPAVAARPPAALAPVRRTYEYTDRATGKRLQGFLPDEEPKFEKFGRQAKLTAEQREALRDRLRDLSQKQAAMAAQMVRDGHWESVRFTNLDYEFWGNEYRNLPSEQAAGVSKEFYPLANH